MSRRANGEGTIWKKPDGRWCGAVYAQTTKGTRKRVYVYGKTRTEAREKLTALQRDLDRGVRVPTENWTVEAYLTHWLDTVVKPHKAPKTHQGYELVVRRHILPTLGRKRLKSLSVPDVRNLVEKLQEQGMGTRGVQQTHAVLRNALQSAMRDELVVRNVAKLVQVKTPRYEVGRGLSVEQARTLLRHTKSDRLHALYVLAIYLGLRRGEVLALRWSDVDLDQEFLQVTHTLQRVDGELRFQPPKTRTSRRTVPLPRPCVEAMKAHKVAQDRERLAAGPKWCDEDMVFSTTIGTPIEPDNLSRSWYRVRTVLGEPAPRFHDMRHTCVSLLLAEGAPPHVVQQIVGHSAIDVTMTIYAHASLDEKRTALQRLGERLA
ncbi:MAG: tyrosine-type recombinase/integrase [Actinomycetota bacterium]